ncbi:hypothetical protein PC9H_007641 [Pleurotus ostreatus]|uniref:Queuosine 5'-phosphate N-glycosylase/hydrolase n=2 Tax=Pleurotus ostreatus TaxID=5322 RepID=A0A8H7DRQ9_PLEOS|nr:uncharacterized protein PC9H_007641 [Pleurotus ostreatus]KAF7428417.1 hypothetical protein PC9H_007641 [Pleurotus ostreatus]KAJ8696557.1 hypothetical protein PTI98_006417 [Pleurotus ostreatus]
MSGINDMRCPFPPNGKYLDAIRSSSKALRLISNVKIESEPIQRLITSPAFTSSFKRVSAVHGLALPLNFPSTASELNLISILSLLNFGSGFRVPLHQATGRGAWDNIRALVFSMYLMSSTDDEGDLLSARGLKAVGTQKVAELMRVSVHVEKPHESIPGVTVGTLGGPMYDLVQLITNTLNETGRVLVDTGYPDLGSFVIEALKEGAKAGATPDAEVDTILDRLVRAIPGFRDMGIVDSQPIYCFKKALFLIHAIKVRFGTQSSAPFPIPSTAHLPVFTDNVLPSMLIHLGVIDLSESALSSIFPNVAENLPSLLEEAPSDKNPPSPSEGPILSVEQAYVLRASAIDACEMIIAEARASVPSKEGVEWIKDITLPELDMWIWGVAKDRSDYRQLERFVLRETIFF